MSLLMGGPVVRQPKEPLLPCPFCGEDPVFLWNGEYNLIECYGCGARGPVKLRSSRELIQRWNHGCEALARDAGDE